MQDCKNCENICGDIFFANLTHIAYYFFVFFLSGKQSFRLALERPAAKASSYNFKNAS